MKPNTKDMGTKRRNLLRSIGVGLFASSVPAGLAASRGSKQLPTQATGKRIFRFEPNGDTYDVHQKFISQTLNRVYEVSTVKYDPITVERERLPTSVVEANGTVVVQYDDAGVFGTVEEHLNAERRLRNRSDDVSTQDEICCGGGGGYPGYDGPLYTYVSASVDERTGPINVVWRRNLGLTAGMVQTKMANQSGWDGYMPSGDRYILIRDDGTNYAKEQDKHVKNATGTTSQYHGRLWNVPSSDAADYNVVCQAHHDPWDHDKCCNNDNWKFEESENKVLDTWANDISGDYGTGTVYAGNGSGYGGDGSADNYTGVVADW